MSATTRTQRRRSQGLLSEKLGDAQEFTLSITYQEPPEPADKLPDPEVCEERIAEVQARNQDRV